VSVDVEAPSDPGSSADPGFRPVRVTAVLVVHDGAQWLPRTLGALAGSLRRPDLVVAVDAGSRDRCAVLLDTAVGCTPTHVVDAVIQGRARDGFGASVARGLAAADQLRAEAREPRDGGADPDRVQDRAQDGTDDRAEEWVWLVHDDSAPEPETLQELLSVVRASPTLAVAGCKQLEWDDSSRLVEVGATVTAGGRRLTDVGQGDIDQGQHDGRGDVLVVSTAGMLVRRSVLDHVGGFDPALPLVGDDVDLCLRVRRAGHRVAVVPTAAVRHVSALERGLRPADALHGRFARRAGRAAPRADDGAGLASARRRHWLHSRLVQAPALLLPLLWLWVLLVAPVRAAMWLLRGNGHRAWAELDAAGRLWARGWRVTGSRWRSRRSRAVPASALRPLQRSRTQVLREDLDAWRARRSLRRQDAVADDGDGDDVPLEAVESGPVDEDLIDLDLGASGPARHFFGHPLTYLVPLTALLGALPVLRSQLSPVAVDAEGAVLGTPDPTAGLTSVELWARWLTGWRDVGLGAVGAADPATAVWAALTALTSLPRGALDAATLGEARTAVAVLAPLLGLLAAYAVLRRLVRSRAGAAAGAATWALLPVTGLLGPAHAGDLVVHVLAPLLLGATVGCLGRRAVRSVAAAGLLAAVVVALSPATWPVLLVVAVLIGVLGGARSLASWRACLPLVAAATPALVWAPWLPALRRDPRALLLDPASVDPSLLTLPNAGALLPTAARVGDVLRGDVALAADLVAVAVAVVLLLLVLAALLGSALLVASLARARVGAAWWALGTAALAAATGVLAVVVASSSGATPSVPASAVALALLVVVGLLVRDLHDPDRAHPRHGSRGRRVVAVLARVGTGLLPAAAVAAAVAVALVVPTQVAPAGLPAPALVGAQSPQATRTLLLQADVAATGPVEEVVAWQVTAGQPGPGRASVATLLGRDRAAVRPGDRRLEDVVASLLGDGSVPGAEVAAALARLGVGWVVVSGDGAPVTEVDTALAQRTGLVRTAVEPARTTWRVDTGGGPVPARARIVDAAGVELGPVDLQGALGATGDGAATQPAPVDATAVTDGATGTTGTSTDGSDASQPPGATGRPGGTADATSSTPLVAAGDPGRLLVVADNARAGWRASIDGAALTPTTVDGWAQAFLLPTAGGELRLDPPMARPGSATLSFAALLLLGLLLVWPGRRRQAPLDLGRRQAPSSDGRPSLLRRSGRGVAATAAVGVTALLLLLATGTGVGPGVLRLDRDTRAAVSTVPAGSWVGDRAEAAVDALPVAADPVAGAPAVSLAAAGAVPSCAVPGGDTPATPAPAAGPEGQGVGGLTVQLDREGDARGLRVAACPSTAVSSWVVLGGTGVGERPRLLLANPGETGATVDVELGGPDGPVLTPSGTGILLGPGERAEVALDALAPDLPAVLARVTARSGSVAVTGLDSGLAGLVPQGGDAVPAQVDPAEALVLPSVVVPAGGGDAHLVVGSVGDAPAVVQLQAVPAAGTGGPADAPSFPLLVTPAGGVVQADLSVLPAGTYSLRLQADAPVVAAASWTVQRDGDPLEGSTGVPSDRARVQAVPAAQAWTGAVEIPLTALQDVPGALEGTVLTVVGAGADTAAARLQLLDEGGAELSSAGVEVPAAGVPLDVALTDVLAGVDPAAVDSLVVQGAAGVHLALRVTLADVDGPLVAATTVPGAPAPTGTVRLVPQ